MSEAPAAPTPDFNQMAAQLDHYLPQIHPVAEAILAHLPPLADGAAVLDVACGTGEPGLTLARRSPGVRVHGVDAAPAMINVARNKASREGVENIRFDVMSSEAPTLADESVDAVISRFGLLMFGDVRASAREVVRRLRKGGAMSLAVWDDMKLNTLVYSLTMLLRDHLPKGQETMLLRLNELAAEGFRARLLEEAGLGGVQSEMFRWTYEFDSFEGPWDLLSRMGMITGQAALPKETQEQIKVQLMDALSAYKQPSGGYRIPHACRLFWGTR